MFSYFGSKSKIVRYYPSPRYPFIIEPFCGSARYSLLYKERQVWINDYWPIITDVWQWIVKAEQAEIDALPELQYGEYLSSYNLPRQQRTLLSFTVNRGNGFPNNKMQKWSVKNGETSKLKKRLSLCCPLIRHWKITNVDYRKLPNVEATWFIDPPYEKQGHDYKHGSKGINYAELAEWCKSRKGQVIVCESDSAEWLPFKFLKRHQAQTKYRTTYDEMIWTNE